MKNQFFKIISILVLPMFIIVVLLGLSGCSNKQLEGVVFNTGFNVEGINQSERSLIEQRLNDLESTLSANDFYSNSELNKINQASKDTKINIGNDFKHLFNVSKEINEDFKSFNPSVYPLVEKWKFNYEFVKDYSPNEEDIPSKEDIDKLLPICSLEYFNLNQDYIVKSVSEAKLDFGAIAKGYAVDEIFNIIESKNKVVNIGGTIKSKKSIDVEVLHPRNSNKTFAKVNVEDEAIATSGDYNRYYYFEGKRYHHIIDPSNGYPTGFYNNNPVISATVVGPSAEICDALSTVFMIESKENIEKALKNKKFKDYSALLIYKDETYFTLGDKVFDVY